VANKGNSEGMLGLPLPQCSSPGKGDRGGEDQRGVEGRSRRSLILRPGIFGTENSKYTAKKVCGVYEEKIGNPGGAVCSCSCFTGFIKIDEGLREEEMSRKKNA